MTKTKRNIGQEILDGIREIKQGEHGPSVASVRERTGGTEIISIRVDEEAARAFKSVSDDDRKKLEALLSIRLTELAHSEVSLDSVVQDIRRKAVEHGLTPDFLKTLLDEK